MKLNELTIKQAHEGLKNKDFSSVELTGAVLEQIRKKDKDIHAYLEVAGKPALKQAEKADKLISEGEGIGFLRGIPIAIKDNILIKGVRCTAGSKILENYIAPYDATVIAKLNEAGAIFVGKTNMDEFAMGSSTENSTFGPTKNPRNLNCVPGGSSGGSAAAVAANETISALGSDTGGSIRQPASFCGVVGLKPTYGRVSRYGLIAMASSLDQIGPIGKTTEDAAIILSFIEGKDGLDSNSAGHYLPLVDRLESLMKKVEEACSGSYPLNGLKIGIPNEYFVKGIDSEVDEIIRQEILKLEKLGARIDGVNLPHTEYALPCYYVVASSEISANLARYDGIKFGESPARQGFAPPDIALTKSWRTGAGMAGGGIRNQESGIKDLLDVYLKTRGQYLGKEVRRRIMLGTYALSSGYYDAYYLRAQKVRSLIKKDFEAAFEKFDILVTPTSPSTAFKIGEKADDPLKMYLSDIYTVPANLAGVPAISIPCGEIGGLPGSSPPVGGSLPGLPVGLQIIGRHFGEETILGAAMIYEQSKRHN